VRKKKLLAIGTMLEPAMHIEKRKSVNKDMPLPKVFINTKIYGYNTDEPDLFTIDTNKNIRPDQEHSDFKIK